MPGSCRRTRPRPARRFEYEYEYLLWLQRVGRIDKTLSIPTPPKRLISLARYNRSFCRDRPGARFAAGDLRRREAAPNAGSFRLAF